MENRFDLAVIGSGPGGYVAAIKAAKLGMKTVIIESREIGGTCLNRGCIPTKTLIHSSQLYKEAGSFAAAGIHFDGLSFDMEQLQDRKEEVVQKIRQGITALLKTNQVEIIYGIATILKDKRIFITPVNTNVNEKNIDSEIQDKDMSGNIHKKDTDSDFQEKYKDGFSHGKNTDSDIHDKDTDNVIPEKSMNNEAPEACNTIRLSADKILIATGSKPVIPKLEGVRLKNVVTSDELLSKRALYKKLLIIGGGVIGIEFASIYSDLGCVVEIIEAMDRILPGMDKEIAQSVALSLKKKGVNIHVKSKVTEIAEGENGMLICEYEEKESLKTTCSDGVLLSVGRKANTDGLFALDAAIERDGAAIRVNEAFETSIQGIYAIGDAVKSKQLAHAASAQGIAAVEGMCGLKPSVNLSVIPSCIYTSPEIASVGLGEEEAIAAGYTVKVGKYPMLGNAKTLLSMGERGFIKVICDAATDRILGAQLLCERATDMVSEFATAIVNGLNVKDMASVIRPHPTYSEAVTEAVEDVEGMAIHLLPKR